MVLASQLFLLSTTVEGFQNRCDSRLPSTVVTTRADILTVNSKAEDDNDIPLSVPLPTPSSQLEEGTFNPFDYKRNTKNSSRSAGSTPPRVDLRSIRMSSVTGDLLNNLGDKAAMRTILEDNRDFLLEPLEVPDSLAVRFAFGKLTPRLIAVANKISQNLFPLSFHPIGIWVHIHPRYVKKRTLPSIPEIR